MFNLPFFRSRRDTLGLDVGSSAIKAVQLSRNNGSFRLEALGIAPVPPDVIVEGAIREPAAVAQAIHEAVGKAGVHTKDAAIALSGRELIIKKLQIPKVPPKELPDAVQLEAEHHIPFSIDEVFLDYHVVGTPDELMDLILVAVKKSKVTEYVSVVEAAGLNAVVVDVDGFALGNQFELNHPNEQGEA
ncbi:MAG: type IV pilus biogenesis protein PilM, partial [Actinomycetota bacterium]